MGQSRGDQCWNPLVGVGEIMFDVVSNTPDWSDRLTALYSHHKQPVGSTLCVPECYMNQPVFVPRLWRPCISYDMAVHWWLGRL